MEEHLLCMVVSKLHNHYLRAGQLHVYSRTDCTLRLLMPMGDKTDIRTASCAMDGEWLYLAGGRCAEQFSWSSPSKSAKRLNLNTLKWEQLPDMECSREDAIGVLHAGRLLVVGGKGARYDVCVAQIYNPLSNDWTVKKKFVPDGADHYDLESINGQLFLLTYSRCCAVKLWQWSEESLCNGEFKSIYSIHVEVKPECFKTHGVRLVQIGNELLVFLGVPFEHYRVRGSLLWPVLPPPFFRASKGRQTLPYDASSAHVSLFSPSARVGDDRVPPIRQIPVYMIGHVLVT